MLKNIVRLGITLVSVALLGLTAVALTADEIMDMVDTEADALAEGSMVSIIRFDNVYGDGTTGSNLFGSLSIPNRSIIYFIEPLDVAGTIFLTHESDDDDVDARLWLYLPLLGIPKEMVSEEERGGSFAGSALSYSDLGDREGRADYDAVLIGEEDVVIEDRTRTAYKIESTAKPDANVDDPRSIVWIDTEFLIMLKVKSYNDLGNLSTTMEVLALGEFEGKLTATEMLATNLSDGSSTTITILEQRRPETEISEDVFLPDNMQTFDPVLWGFAE
ncbi:MAG: outer membrane lipoprotein-sorting protein [Candidatus Bipolaricaulota bacterium]|nr:outer membrane lipoprotein-sorting protein [Candidatus Bipolaricaulota bacterium]